ncbi:MAG: hypothetical protein ACE5LU_16020 [Anaerolineae bacterium]
MTQKRTLLFVAGLLALALSTAFAMFHWPTPTTAQGPAWEWFGDAGTDPALHYVGTNDRQPLVLRAFRLIGIYLQPPDPSGSPDLFNTPRVGIGTTRPEAGLDVANDNLFIRDFFDIEAHEGPAPDILIESEPTHFPGIGGQGFSHIVLADGSGHDDVVVRSGDGGSIHLGVANDEKVRLASNGDSWFTGGNVGIGTVPTTTFHVVGESLLNGAVTVTNTLRLEGSLVWECETCILSSDIDDQAVISRTLAPDVVTSDKIAGGAITSADIGSGEVISRTLATDAVTSSKIDDDAITSAHIGDEQVKGNHLARESVAADKVISSQVQLRIGDACEGGTAIVSVGADGKVSCVPLGATDEVGTSASDDPKPLRFKTNGKEVMRITAETAGIGQVGIGTVRPRPGAALHVAGTTRTKSLTVSGGLDLAEPFAITSVTAIEPGMVVVIDPDNPGQLRIADRTYDRTVAGVISGAGGIQPGVIMEQAGFVTDRPTHPVALTGRVYVWADATAGPIQPGDLLTTSDRPGHAMKVTDYQRAQGAILGKAMMGLEQGTGLVLILVKLQ